MDFNILKARGTNRILGMLIIVQLAMLFCIGMLIMQLITGDMLPVSTVFSSVFLILFCLPLSLFLGTSRQDLVQKTIFRSLALTFAIIFVSGFLWDIVPLAYPEVDLAPVAKVLMLLSYVPILVGLVRIFRGTRVNVPRPVRTYVVFIDVAVVALILLFIATRLPANAGNTFDAAVYALSIVGDIVILSAVTILAMHFMQNQLRYLFMIMLAFFTMALAGDALNLMGSLGSVALMGYARTVYDLMFILTAVALLLFTTGSSPKVITVEEVNRKLYDTKSLMSDLIMQSPDAVCVFDAQGDAVMANRAFGHLVNMSPADVTGKINLFRDTGRLVDGPVDVSGIRDGGMVVFEGRKAGGGRNGPEHCYQVKAFPAYGSEGKINGYITFIADITDTKRYEAELIHAKAQAELYLDLMAHDIINMNQIGIGFLELALDRLYLDREGNMLIRKPLEAMLNSSHLIDNVKKIRRADIRVSCLEPIDLGNVLGEVISNYYRIPDRDAVIDYVPVSGCYVMANPLLKDVFANLISNAYQHSTGPLRVYVKVEPVVRDLTRSYQVTIEDNGPGIPDELKHVIMDREYRIRTRTGGRGLGLYLVKTLVESFNGTIAVEDRVPGDRSHGTRVIVMLPAAEGPNHDAGNASVACN